MFTTVKRIIDWCGDFKGRLVAGFVFSFFSYWFAAAPVMAAAFTCGRLIEAYQGKAEFDSGFIPLSISFIAVSIFLRFLFDYLRARFQETISYELVARDRLAVGDALKRVSLGYFQKINTGNILSSLTTGLTTLEGMGIRMIDNFIGGYLNFLVIFISLAVIKPVIALIALGAAAVSFAGLVIISSGSRKNSPEAARSDRALTSAVIEYSRGLPVVKSYGKGSSASAILKKSVENSRKIHTKIEWCFIPPNCLHLLALKCGSVGIAFAACIAGLSGELSMPFMLMLILLSFIIFSSIEPISDSAHTLGIIDDAMNQLEMLKKENFIDSDGQDIKPGNFNIEYKNVCFGYDSRQIIKDVSFTIPEKTSTAIVGPSGSGKTTLVNLLSRFYDVDSGSITLGGHNLKEFTCDSLLTNISMVFQNVYLFNDTVRANICFGRPDTTEEEMTEAAKKACCHDFIMNLPDGYDTVIGEGGNSLSGGEKQRISIARAILKDAPVIILDEATASVDPENEHLIQNAISELTRGKTVIIIAHRLKTIETADKILVLDDGKIAECGTHEELMAADGIYRRFAEARRRAEDWSIG